MATPYVGEIRLYAAGFAPPEWARCDGQLLSKSENEFLFSVIGVTYGGDGVETVGVPDLRGRVPLNVGPERALGLTGGQERVTLALDELPGHTHALRGSRADGDQATPSGNVWARSEALGFSTETPDAVMHEAALASVGGGTAHENLMPFLGVSSILALTGLSPGELRLDDVYAGEIRIMASDFVPERWVRCDGRLLSVADEALLFSLIGTTYGGDGVSTFAVPNLSARVPVHRGPGRPLATAGGAAEHAINSDELPAHSHAARAAAMPGDDPSPRERSWGVQSAGLAYATAPDVSLHADAVSAAGASKPHDNMPPFLTLNICIALEGEHPMSEAPATQPFVGEIRMFAYDSAPINWAFCDGQILPIAQNEPLFGTIATAYGGDGQTTFALPDLRERAPLHPGQGPGLSPRTLGQSGGAATVTLETAHLPAHTHRVRARATSGGAMTPEGSVFGAAQARALSAGYSSEPPTVPMAPSAVGSAGSGQPHNNMPPHLAVAFCISLLGS